MKINYKIIFALFLLLAAAQLYVSVQMIFDKEKIISDGTAFKFKIAPVDPLDYFRGEYLRINFAISRTPIECDEQFDSGDEVYIVIGTDDSGFAKIQSTSKEKPRDETNYVTARVNWVSGDSDCALFLDFPFEKYFMKEGTAYLAEDTIRGAVRDSSKIVYAEVQVKDGDAVVTEIFLGENAIEDVIKEMNSEK